jgi:thioredoxin reductase (NADPH)
MKEYDIIVIGAGIAGLTAAIYLRRASKKVLVLEARSYGGQIVNASKIENYPAEPNISGFELAQKIYNQAVNLGVEVLFEKVVNIESNASFKEVITSKNRYRCLTIILATGSDSRKLGLDNEDKLVGKGISYCATCDGNFYKGKVVAVVGGGETAIEDVIYLSHLASKVYLIYRKDNIEYLDKLKNINNLEIVCNSHIIQINGDNHLESIDIKNNDGKETNIKLEGLFIAIGRTPENQNFAKLLNLDDNGYIISNEDCNTNVPGIFVAGDARTKKLRQLVTAASDGAVAATEAIKFINH